MSNRDCDPALLHKHNTSVWRHLIRAAVFLLPFFYGQLCVASWREYRSDHFQLYSDRKPKDAKALLLEFDKFHQVAVQLLGFVDEPRKPVTVFVFNEDSEFRALEPDKQIAGFYRSSWQGPFMVVGGESKLADVSLILFHEYVHHLLRSSEYHSLPLWFEEGVADLLATAKIDGDYAIVGEVHPWREQSLKNYTLLPIVELLSTNYDNTDNTFWSRYYASSWLLLHYLHFGSLSDLGGGKITSIPLLLQQLQQSKKASTFLEETTRLDTTKLEESLKQYRGLQELSGVRMKIRLPKWKAQQYVLDKNQQAFILGELAYQLGKPKIAREYLQQVDASRKTVGPALALRSIIEYHRGQSDIAFHFMSSAQKRAPNDPKVLTLAAHLYWDKLMDSRALSKERQNVFIDKTKRFAHKALRENGENIEALRFLWRVQKFEGNHALALQTMREALKLKPEDVALNFEVGSYLISQQEQALARPHLELVLEKDHSLKRKRQALTMLMGSDPQKVLVESGLDHH